jgi:hypothetical protein
MSEPAEQGASSTPVCTFTGFNKRKQRGNVRKRKEEADDEPEEEHSPVVRLSKAKKESALDFSSSKVNNLEPGAVRDGTKFKVESSRLVQQNTDNGATRELETETQKDRDGRALREQVQSTGDLQMSTVNSQRNMLRVQGHIQS